MTSAAILWPTPRMKSSDLSDLAHALSQGWGIGLNDRATREDLLQAIAARVAHFIEHDFEKLLFSMYAIDISEDEFARVMDPADTKGSADAIAELILEREIEKMELRKRYARPDAICDQTGEGDAGESPRD